MNGCLTGLVAVTAPCASIEPWAAVVVGITAGWAYLIGSWTLIRFKIDDAVDAIPVHMVGGAWGLICTGLFSNETRLEAAYGITEYIGWFMEWGRGSGSFNLIGAQLISVLFIFGWTFVVMGVYFYVLNYFGWFRIDEIEELVGMDVSRHKGSAYDMGVPQKEHVDQLNLSRSSRKLKIEQEEEVVNDNNVEVQAVEEQPRV
jgi:Amt family ammonium transporter